MAVLLKAFLSDAGRGLLARTDVIIDQNCEFATVRENVLASPSIGVVMCPWTT